MKICTLPGSAALLFKSPKALLAVTTETDILSGQPQPVPRFLPLVFSNKGSEAYKNLNA